eukprot:6455367-Amphidinium_carterae.2
MAWLPETSASAPAAVLHSLSCQLCKRNPEEHVCREGPSLNKSSIEAHLLQEVEFKKGKKVCVDCPKLVARGFPGKTLDEVVLLCQTSPNVQKEVQQALSVMHGATKSFLPETFENYVYMQLLCDREHLLLSEAEFEHMFDITASRAGATIDEIELENGEKVKGVLIVNPNNPYLKITTRTVKGTALCEHLQTADAQYRPSQTKELQSWYQKDLLKLRPKGLQHPMTVAAMRGQVVAAKAAEEAAASAPAVAATEEAGNTEPAEQQDDPDDDDDDSEPDNMALPALPSSSAPVSKKGKGRGEKRSIGGSTPAVSPVKKKVRMVGKQSSKASVKDGKSVAGSAYSAFSSIGGNSQSSSSPSCKLRAELMEYVQRLDLQTILDGRSNGNLRHILKRKLVALDKQYQGTAEAVNSQAHLQLVNSAFKLTAKNMFTIDAKLRTQYLEEVMPHVANPEELNGDWQSSIFTHTIKERAIATTEDIQWFCGLLSASGGQSNALSLVRMHNRIVYLSLDIITSAEQLVSFFVACSPRSHDLHVKYFEKSLCNHGVFVCT